MKTFEKPHSQFYMSKYIFHLLHLALVLMLCINYLTYSLCCRCCGASSAAALRGMLDVGLLRDPFFLLIALSNMFIQLSYFVPMVYMSEYALSKGIPSQDVATVISVIGEYQVPIFDIESGKI